MSLHSTYFSWHRTSYFVCKFLPLELDTYFLFSTVPFLIFICFEALKMLKQVPKEGFYFLSSHYICVCRGAPWAQNQNIFILTRQIRVK